MDTPRALGQGFVVLFFSLPVSIGAGILAAITLHGRMNGDAAMNPLFLLGGAIAGVVWCFTPFARENRLGHVALTFVGAMILMAVATVS